MEPGSSHSRSKIENYAKMIRVNADNGNVGGVELLMGILHADAVKERTRLNVHRNERVAKGAQPRELSLLNADRDYVIGIIMDHSEGSKYCQNILKYANAMANRRKN